MNVDCNWSRPVLQILQQGVTWQRTKNLHATKTDGFWYFFLMRFVYTRWIIMALNFHSLLFCTTMNYMKLHFSAEKKRKQFLCNSRKREKRVAWKKAHEVFHSNGTKKENTHTHTKYETIKRSIFLCIRPKKSVGCEITMCRVQNFCTKKKSGFDARE